jgi:uncharacterized membrane protein
VTTRGPATALLRSVMARPRLIAGVVLGVAAAIILFREPVSRRLVLGWDIGLVVYLALALVHMARSDVARIKRTAESEDEGRVALLVLSALAALASLGVIVAELGGFGRHPPGFAVALSIATILLSWFFVHTVFAFHYAHEFYGVKARGLEFPGEDNPDYWDFAYFSFVIGMTFQVSDVQVKSRRMRRTVVAHGIVAFLFNSALLALAVNIAASVVGGG